MRCFGKDWNRRESGEKVLLGMVAGGCGRDCSGRLVFVGLQCGANMVAKIRRNFCQYRMLCKRLDRRESEEKALLEELLRNFCQYRMLTRL